MVFIYTVYVTNHQCAMHAYSSVNRMYIYTVPIRTYWTSAITVCGIENLLKSERGTHFDQEPFHSSN